MNKIEQSKSSLPDSFWKYLAIAFLYSWSFYSRATYTAFFAGIISTLFAEAFMMWKYLASKILKESGQKINLSLGTCFCFVLFKRFSNTGTQEDLWE